MKILSVLLVALLLGNGCSQLPLLSKTEKDLGFGNQKSISRFTLSNGLRLIVLEDKSSPTFAYQTWFKVGSRNEKINYTGLAHLFEHMMFKGTKKYPDGKFDKILEAAGAEGENAFTSRDYTAYVQELPKDKLELIIELESDRMTNLVVDQKSFKTETEVVQNERRYRNENNPDGLMYQEAFNTSFTVHPYHWPVIGYEEDLNRMNASDAMEFYQNHYSPNHATIVVVGDVQAENVLKLVQKYYGNLPAKETPSQAVPQEPEQTSPRQKTLKLNIQVEKILIAYRIPGAGHIDLPALALAKTVLAGGKSSRLHQALVEKGIMSSIDAYDLDDKDPSLLIFSGNLQKGRSAKLAETLILSEIKRLTDQPITEKELQKAKNGLSFQFYLGISEPYEKAKFIGLYETLQGDYQKGFEILEQTQRINPTQLQAVIKKYLNPDKRNTILGVSK